MNTVLFTHPACLEHDTGVGHPECSERLVAILRMLEGERFHLLERRSAPRAEVEQLARCHPREHVERLLASIPADGHVELDNDTILSPGTGEAALRAAGSVVAAVDAVYAGEARNAFCAVRPPGHHAEANRSMGFCLFNNAAVGAFHARAVHGIERAAVIDFDVHHGNGTQDIFAGDPGMFYASIHQWPLYPGTGAAEERGHHDNVVNAPLPALAGSPEFRHAMSTKVFPALERFKPELIIISAGFDAHTRDPLAALHLVEDDYVWVTRKLGEFAREYCGARLVSVLEGGYDIRALASSCAAHVEELMYA
jgi:acetoin utilization deacetylase AcuC-like enzyme